MNIQRMNEKWRNYKNECRNSEEMSIEKHIEMASQVGDLIKEVKRLTSIIEQNRLPLYPCSKCGKEEKNPGLSVCGSCYHKQMRS